MLTVKKWVVCEKSGRWAAALRTTFERLPKGQSMPRLHEVRTVEGLSTQLDAPGRHLALIEVGRNNLAEVLQLLVRRGPRLAQFVALLEDASDQSRSPAVIDGEPSVKPVADLLWEMGAAEVVESPRQLGGLLALHDRLAAALSSNIDGVAERQSFVDWAWSTLPWQDP